LADVDAGRWQRIMQINLGAPFLLTRALFPLLAQGAPAKVVFIGDSSIGMGKAYWNAYGVAKLGLEGYARILADETESSGVGVRLFTPGPMRTPIRRQAYPGETPELLPAAESVAAAVLDLLCS
jgi:NAD(P)-dependent dehydrogenase (short-subunit alcohol dehydrogenase family)